MKGIAFDNRYSDRNPVLKYFKKLKSKIIKTRIVDNEHVDKAIYNKNSTLRCWGSYKEGVMLPLRKFMNHKTPTYEQFCDSIIGLHHRPKEVRALKKEKLPTTVKFGQVKRGNTKEIEKHVEKLHPVALITQKTGKDNLFYVQRYYIYIYINN